MTTEALKAPSNPFGPSPLRRPGSIRRTSTIDTNWPEGAGKPMRMRGHARDLYTPADGGSPVVVAEDRMEILATMSREILEISTTPPRPAVQQLVGQRGGGHLRGELARVLPQEKKAGSPLYLLLDDFSGASLVAGWAWSRWSDEWMKRMRENSNSGPAGRSGRPMEGICAGFRPGSSALAEDGTSRPDIQSSAAVVPLARADDPIGWHELAQQEGVGMRRARRIDTWIENGVIQMDVGFQDSSTAPQGGRIAVHEYHVMATADPKTHKLLSIEVDPRVLPYRECPAASPNAAMMLGTPLDDMRLEVLNKLPGTLGCTHLNDVLRSIAEVPQLLACAEAQQHSAS